ncbi:MAG: hypothetical protein HFJ80_05320 [Clostridiales bacterium]|nr:hypothetical protein [Clostridiales bacterium]
MTMDKVLAVLGASELPERYAAGLERFCAEWPQIRTQPVLETETLRGLAEEGFLDAACFPDVEICLQKTQADEALDFTLHFLAWMLLEYGGPWDLDLYFTPAPPALGEYGATFALILFLLALQSGVTRARERQIPEKMIEQLKGPFFDIVGNHRQPWGVGGAFHWNTSCSFGTMFFVDTYRYELHTMPDGYRMYRRRTDGRLLAVYTLANRIDEYGQIAWEEEQTAFRTEAFGRRSGGYLIHPEGRIINRPMELPETEWEPVFCEGDRALSYHIPGNIRYSVDTLQHSFQEALRFYNRHFSDLNVRGIQCYSWLYSPQLREILSSESHINRLNAHLYLCPVPSGPDGFHEFVFHTGEFDPETAPAETSLQRGFIDFVRRGGRAHNGFMYLPAADVARLAEEPRSLYCYDLFE